MSISVSRNWKGNPIKRGPWMEVAKKWVAEVAPFAEDMVKEYAPVYHGYSIRESGKLKRSISAVGVVTNNTATITIDTGVPYAEYVIGGAAPHIIVPRKANMLKWNGPAGTMFASRVNHPGQKPNDFVAKAMKEVEPLAMEMFAALYRESFVIVKE